MTREPSWSASGLPWVRRGLVAMAEAEAVRNAGLQVRALRAGQDRVLTRLQSAGDGFAFLAHRMRGASLFWVTPSMTRVAMDAATDVPSIRPGDAPDRDGLIAFATPLPPYDVESMGGLALRDGSRTDVPHNGPVVVDALGWMIEARKITVSLLCRPRRLPLPLTPHDGPLIEFGSLVASLPTLLGGPVPALGGQGVDADSEARGVLSLLSACWVLMMTPTVADRKTLDYGGGGGSGSKTPQADRSVTIVDLRPIRHVEVDHEEGTGRKLTTRHYVRGHWTNQPFGPGRSLRRLQWIAPYIRGPEGAPLVQHEQVMVWRR